MMTVTEPSPSDSEHALQHTTIAGSGEGERVLEDTVVHRLAAPPTGSPVPGLVPPETKSSPKGLGDGHRRRKWIIAVVAPAAAVALIVGLLMWAPWGSTAPRSPDSLRGSAPDATSILVQWDPASSGPDVDEYLIMQDGEQVATVSASETSFLVQGLSPNTTYTFTVVAVAGDQRSDPSPEVVVTTPPATPESVTGSAPDATSILVQWDPASSGPDVDEYLIVRDGEQVAAVPASETSFLVQGLSPGTSYALTVVAVAGDQRSDPSPEAVVTTLAPSPEGLAADPTTTTADSVTFTWSPPPNSPVPDEYVVIRDGETIATIPATTTSYMDTALAPATEYAYQVRAAWGTNLSSPTAVVAMSTIEPPVSDARLAGSWPVDVTIDSSPGGDLEGGETWTETWDFSPDGTVSGVFAPPGYTYHRFSATLTRDGAGYTGTTTAHITHCGSTDVEVQNTVSLWITVETARVEDNAWLASSWVGTMVLDSPYTSAGEYYCPAQSVSATIFATR